MYLILISGKHEKLFRAKWEKGTALTIYNIFFNKIGITQTFQNI